MQHGFGAWLSARPRSHAETGSAPARSTSAAFSEELSQMFRLMFRAFAPLFLATAVHVLRRLGIQGEAAAYPLDRSQYPRKRIHA